MDISEEFFLESLAQAQGAHPRLATFRVTPFRITCHQGEQSYAATVLARRGPLALFIAAGTRQFGIGFLESSHDEAMGARQYPTGKMAALMFLGDAKGLDPD